jgi:hypothetical protein
VAIDVIGGPTASADLAYLSLRVALQQGQAAATLATQATQQAKQVNASGNTEPDRDKNLDIEA